MVSRMAVVMSRPVKSGIMPPTIVACTSVKAGNAIDAATAPTEVMNPPKKLPNSAPISIRENSGWMS